MNENVNQQCETFTKGGEITARKLNAVVTTVNRLVGSGVNPPSQKSNPKTGTTVYLLADIASTANRSSLTGSSGSIDGVAIAGKTILLKNQITANIAQHGLYKVPASGSGAWTKLAQPDFITIKTGTVGAGTQWYLSAANTYTRVTARYA